MRRQSSVAVRGRLFPFAVTILLAACARSTGAPPLPPAMPFPAGTLPLSQRNLGATALAAVYDARTAIALKDTIAADNDVGEALAFATQLIDRPGGLFASEPAAADRNRPSARSGVAGPPVRLTAFAVRVRLTSAEALLTTGNLAGAEAELLAVQNAVPAQSVPKDLSLLRAGASLDLARDAASTGRIAQLRTQLICAGAALQAYNGHGHIRDVRALASRLDEDLAQPTRLRTLLPYQVSVWLGQVAEWAGNDRW